MQIQPKAERRTQRVQRARQARHTADDAFKGGDAPNEKLSLTKPWMTGSGRLWKARDSAADSE